MYVVWSTIWCVCLMASVGTAWSQSAILKGKVIDPFNNPIDGAKIQVEGTKALTYANEQGSYRLSIPATGELIQINITHAGHQPTTLEIRPFAGRTYDQTVKMLLLETDRVDIVGEQEATSIDDRNAMLISPIDMEDVINMPSVAPSVESYIKYQPGTATNNEFSSQYQVRGGNFDENLVYVNGIEIYRPFLARAGQQEGLGFANTTMTQGINFSTGGFGANYGDRLSSVLDITYRDPREFKATAEVGLMTTNLHLEGISTNKKEPNKDGKFTYLLGARRFDLGYALGTLGRQGSYQPLFMDFQGMFTYTPKNRYKPEKIRTRRDGTQDTVYYPNEPIKITAFTAVTRNRYLSEPVSDEVGIGTFNNPIKFRVFFGGLEISSYNTGLGALMVEHQPNTKWKFDYILSGYQTAENELVDLESAYSIGEVNANLGSSEFGEAEFDQDVGSEYLHARNYLRGTVIAAQARLRYIGGRKRQHRLYMGAKFQHQAFIDDLKEYRLSDSAGFVVDLAGAFDVEEYVRGRNTLSGNQYKAFVQHEWNIGKNVLWSWGTRALYYDITDEWMISPRAQLLIRAMEEKDGQTKLRFRLAGGLYSQPAFYREFRRFDGTLNLDLRAQQALHMIAGLNYRFYMWDRPFLLFAEGYNKQLYNIVPYETQSIRIRYYPDETANGFARGVDMRLNGEFIKGVDSWVSLGILQTEEDVVNDEQGFVRRPTDQRFTFSMYFQDELPTDPTFKVHVSYFYGSGMRHGPPRLFNLRTSFNFDPYHRVDLGFSKIITQRRKAEFTKKRGVESVWATLEIFNLLQIQNTASYFWVKDLQNVRYPVPNRLSGRLLNARVVFKFR